MNEKTLEIKPQLIVFNQMQLAEIQETQPEVDVHYYSPELDLTGFK